MGFSPIEHTSSPEAFCDGVSTLDSTVNHKCQRMSTLGAYLPRATALERRSNLKICTGAIVSGIQFTKSQAKEPRAETVRFRHARSQSDEIFSVTAKHEFIISSDAIDSPQVLMLRSDLLSRQNGLADFYL